MESRMPHTSIPSTHTLLVRRSLTDPLVRVESSCESTERLRRGGREQPLLCSLSAFEGWGVCWTLTCELE
jgi:hypothetical protein